MMAMLSEFVIDATVHPRTDEGLQLGLVADELGKLLSVLDVELVEPRGRVLKPHGPPNTAS
jgi:hypothetical protein